ncbi:MAG: hypothetical protein JXA30_22870 [Deltaproteobacteria bacterium]|nr:hypothetical protein [Deltaproteobacteria bacterium]
MSIEKRYGRIWLERSSVCSRISSGSQELGDRRSRYHRLLRVSLALTLFPLFLSVLLPTIAAAQSSTVEQSGSQKSRAPRKGKPVRAQTNAKTRKGGGQTVRGNRTTAGAGAESGRIDADSASVMGREEDNSQTAAAKGESDSVEASIASKRGERTPSSESDGIRLDQKEKLGEKEESIDRVGSGASALRSNRMEFDARLVYGETAGSGAVILFDRGQRDLPPLTRRRKRFLSATTESVFGSKDELRYRIRDEFKEVEPDNSNDKSASDGLGN